MTGPTGLSRPTRRPSPSVPVSSLPSFSTMLSCTCATICEIGSSRPLSLADSEPANSPPVASTRPSVAVTPDGTLAADAFATLPALLADASLEGVDRAACRRGVTACDTANAVELVEIASPLDTEDVSANDDSAVADVCGTTAAYLPARSSNSSRRGSAATAWPCQPTASSPSPAASGDASNALSCRPVLLFLPLAAASSEPTTKALRRWFHTSR
ncbi:MAG: hypothetical protein QM581_00140 [Pseudomonas sp.]